MSTDSDAERKQRRRKYKAAVAAGAVGGLVQNGLRLETDWKAIWRFFEPWWAQILGVTIAITVGFGLFYVRRRWPRLYAFIEFVFAAISVWAAVDSAEETPMNRFLKLAAGIYLFVRGLDNWNQAPKRIQEWEEENSAAITSAPHAGT